MKACAERIISSLTSVDWAIKAGLESSRLRAETSATISDLNIEIINNTVKAIIKTAQLNAERVVAIVKLSRGCPYVDCLSLLVNF